MKLNIWYALFHIFTCLVPLGCKKLFPDQDGKSTPTTRQTNESTSPKESKTPPSSLTFTEIVLGPPIVYESFIDGNNWYLATAGGLLISSNDGSSFTKRTVADGLPGSKIFSVYASGTTVFAGTDEGLAVSIDSGKTFSQVPLKDFNTSISAIAGQGANLYVGGLTGFLSKDGGQSFTPMNLPKDAGNILDIAVQGSMVFIGTRNGLAVSSDGGANFVLKSISPDQYITRVSGVAVSGTTVFATTAYGVAMSKDNAETFNYTALGDNFTNGVAVNQNLVYVGTVAGLMVSANGGVSYLSQTSPEVLKSLDINAVHTSADKVVLSTSRGLIVSRDSGTSFQNQTSIQGLSGSPILDVASLGSKIYAISIQDLHEAPTVGAAFASRKIATARADFVLNRVLPTDSGVLLGSDKGVMTSKDGGNTYEERLFFGNMAVKVEKIHVDGKLLYALTNNGVYLSKDGGEIFGTPPMTGDKVETSTRSMAISGTTLYVGTGIGISMTKDGGATYSKPKTPTEFNAFGVSDIAALGLDVYAAVGGQLYISRDGGENFSISSGITGASINRLFVHGSGIYAVTDYGLYISNDNGVSYTVATRTNGLGSNRIHAVTVVGTTLFVATEAGFFTAPLK